MQAVPIATLSITYNLLYTKLHKPHKVYLTIHYESYRAGRSDQASTSGARHPAGRAMRLCATLARHAQPPGKRTLAGTRRPKNHGAVRTPCPGTDTAAGQQAPHPAQPGEGVGRTGAFTLWIGRDGRARTEDRRSPAA